MGKVNEIIHRSGLEKRYFKWFDREKSIKLWGSEEFHIPYISPVDKRPHRYFVDVILQMESGERIIAEIKPWSQCSEPKKPKTNNRKAAMRYANELITYEVNQAKWKAAEQYCKERGITFLVLTERNLPKILD